jgi:hypothetical protein
MAARPADALECEHAVRAALEIPKGPICSFVTPGGQRLAIYQLTRPDVMVRFMDRRDF